MQNLPKPVVWAGISFMLVTSFIHLVVAPYAFEDALYKGVLFVVSGISALIAAMEIQEGCRVWGWGLASIVAGATLASYLANVTIGLPRLPAEPKAWPEPLALIALLAEGLTLVLAGWVFGAARPSARRGAHSLVR
jgi:uncharacterized membrane protein